MPETQQELIFYAGEFEKQLDDKRRVTIPAKWRFKGDNSENSYFAIPTLYGAVSVLPPSMMRQLLDKISKISMANAQKRRVLSKFMSQSCTFGCDKQGRIMLDETTLARAGIKKTAKLVGMGATFEIWDPERRNKWLAQSEGDGAEDAALLEELGL